MHAMDEWFAIGKAIAFSGGLLLIWWMFVRDPVLIPIVIAIRAY
jgi:hypothetical protein